MTQLKLDMATIQAEVALVLWNQLGAAEKMVAAQEWVQIQTVTVAPGTATPAASSRQLFVDTPTTSRFRIEDPASDTPATNEIRELRQQLQTLQQQVESSNQQLVPVIARPVVPAQQIQDHSPPESRISSSWYYNQSSLGPAESQHRQRRWSQSDAYAHATSAFLRNMETTSAFNTVAQMSEMLLGQQHPPARQNPPSPRARR
jgi:hypothetical protein